MKFIEARGLLPTTVFLLIVCWPRLSISQNVISTKAELEEFNRLEMLPRYRNDQKVQQISSYDRTGKNDDGFSGTYSFVRRNADSSLVIFEARGPGVIDRVWTPTPTEDTLDFFIDDSIFSIKFSDLFSGKVTPFTYPLCGTALGGNYCYYPILFQDSCKIVSRGKRLQFYQVQWKRYDAATRVQRSFPPFQLRTQVFESTVRKRMSIGPQERIVVFEKKTGGRISGFRMYPASAFAGKVKDKWIRIYYDGKSNPAITAPVADFFGFAFGKPAMQSMLLGVVNDTAYCNIPMPFYKSCRMEVVNNGSKEIEFEISLNVSGVRRDSLREGSLYTSYNHKRYIGADSSHVLLDYRGRGHMVGTILQCQGTVPGMTLFFEGDDSTMVDDELALHGTGSEDYFNGGWYAFPDRWDAALSLPFHGSLDYNLALCRTAAYRFYPGDKIPFSNSIHHSIEHGPVGNNIPAIYTSLSFYYGSNAVNSPSDINNIEIYEPDTMMLYPQVNSFNAWSGVGIKTLWAHETGGMSFIYTVSDETRLRFSLEEIPEGTYELFLDYDRLPSGAGIKALQRQVVIAEWVDSNASDTLRIPMQKIGEVSRSGDMKTITLEFDASPGRDQFFLNRFILVRKNK